MTLTAHWIHHLNTWQSSGMTQAAYCRQHRLNVKT
ncbi:IS66 family insertion sequence element accessory protein TnpA, partial [Methylocucumis oryzae]